MARTHTDLSIVPISVAPSPATSGTSLGVTDANAAFLPDVYPFYAVIKPTGVAPTRSNSEIVKVTAGTSSAGTTTYTVVRIQGIPVTTARTVIVGDDFYEAVSAEVATLDACKLYRTTVQSITNATDTFINFNNELFDNNTMHDNATNNTRITIKTAGLYLILAQVAFTANDIGRRVINLYKNGVRTALHGSGVEYPGSNKVTANVISFSTILNLAVNDYIELGVFQTSGGALNVTSGEVNTIGTSFSAVRIAGTIG